MKKEFNITGICIPSKHFMVDLSYKLERIIDLIENGKYFVINRPHQYGKTTIFSLLFQHSPWNIASDFEVEMSYSQNEISSMLLDYANESNTQMNISLLSEEIYHFTKGYPYLVSKICKLIDEKLEKDWSVSGIQRAINCTLETENTLFDDLIKNLEIYPDLYNLVYSILVEGKRIPFEIYNPIIKLGNTFGILNKQGDSTYISNQIFEKCIYNYMISKKMMSELNVVLEPSQFLQSNGLLNMEQVLNKFQEI
jgi:hypothetical protein